MLAYYGTQISPHMDRTPEGYLICRDVPIARTGPQEYLAKELQLDGDPDRQVGHQIGVLDDEIGHDVLAGLPDVLDVFLRVG